MHGTTPPYVSWGNRSDPVVSRPNHKFAANRASCSSNKGTSALCMQETQIKCRGLDPRCLKARFCVGTSLRKDISSQRHLDSSKSEVVGLVIEDSDNVNCLFEKSLTD